MGPLCRLIIVSASKWFAYCRRQLKGLDPRCWPLVTLKPPFHLCYWAAAVGLLRQIQRTAHGFFLLDFFEAPSGALGGFEVVVILLTSCRCPVKAFLVSLAFTICLA